MRSTRTVLLVAVLLAGCSSGGDNSGSAAPATTPPSASTGLGTAAPTPTVTKATSTAGPTASATGTPRCHSADLKVSDVPDPAGGAAGHHGEFLVFSNASGHRCTLYGYPGVSWVTGDNGTQVNAPFERSGGDHKTVSLAAGAAAHATILLVNPGVYEKADCKPEQVRGYRVYPPDEKASIFVAAPQTACSATGKGLGQVQPIRTGTAD